MKRMITICLLALLCFAACSAEGTQPEQTAEQTTEQVTTEHAHVGNGADCQSTLYCVDCNEVIAEQGEHDYPEEPDFEQGDFAYYTCRICGNIKIVNQNGAPVVPVG